MELIRKTTSLSPLTNEEIPAEVRRDGNDVYLIKTDANGDTVWTRAIGGAAWEIANSVQQTSDGGYIASGYTDSFGAGLSDVYLVRTDANGDSVWTRTYGGTGEEGGHSVRVISDSACIIAGYTTSDGAGLGDVYLIKADADGDFLWSGTYGGTGYDTGYSVQETSAGKYIVVGSTGSFGAGSVDAYMIRVRECRWKARDVNFGPPAPGRGEGEQVVAFSSGMPDRLVLYRSAPNPFNERTAIRFDLPEQGEVSVSIHDVEGRLVMQLVDEVRPPGSHSVPWDGRDLAGAQVSAGIYFVHLVSGDKIATGKVVVAH